MKMLQNEKCSNIIKIQLDHGREFIKQVITSSCDGIQHQLSVIGTPQQNGVVERRNKTLKEVNRTMITKVGLPKRFWDEVVNTTCHTKNITMIHKTYTKTPYEL